jgi:hypothetical protein
MKVTARIRKPKINADFPVLTKVDNRNAKQTRHIPNVKNMANITNQLLFMNISIWKIIPLNIVINVVIKHMIVNDINHDR